MTKAKIMSANRNRNERQSKLDPFSQPILGSITTCNSIANDQNTILILRYEQKRISKCFEI